jgi:class 3 adenylate cyclase
VPIRSREKLDRGIAALRSSARVVTWALRRVLAPRDSSSGQVPGQKSSAQPAASASRSSAAERRQLTVLFCDVVDSTTLASMLDPEDFREVIRAFQAACAEPIQRFEGSVAQYLGDGVLAYFSYPQAHEDDAQRAVHAGLAIIEALGVLNERLHADHPIRLSVRIVIHTGLVVVGEIGTREHHEHLALGATPNVAAHLQSFAAPNTVIISRVTFQLVQKDFDFDDLGLRSVKGVSIPMQLYRVVRARRTSHELELVEPSGLTPLVGRNEELQLLSKRWAQARDGAGQVVVLSGEAGIGKSRLVKALKASLAHEHHVVLECRASAYSQQTALFPVAELVQRELHWQPHDTPAEQLRKLETALLAHQLPLDEMLPLFAEFLSIPLPGGRCPPLALSPKLHRRKVFEALLIMLLSRAIDQPVLFILEDLDRLDASTLEFLTLLIERVSLTRLYVLLTCRPTFRVPWHTSSSLTHLTLPRLSAADTEQIIAWITEGKALPVEVRSILRDKTDGVPLFIEEMTRAILESGALREAIRGYVMVGPLASFTIPTTLHDSLMARLDRLGPSKEIAQWAAVIGRQVSYALLYPQVA